MARPERLSVKEGTELAQAVFDLFATQAVMLEHDAWGKLLQSIGRRTANQHRLLHPYCGPLPGQDYIDLSRLVSGVESHRRHSTEVP